MAARGGSRWKLAGGLVAALLTAAAAWTLGGSLGGGHHRDADRAGAAGPTDGGGGWVRGGVGPAQALDAGRAAGLGEAGGGQAAAAAGDAKGVKATTAAEVLEVVTRRGEAAARAAGDQAPLTAEALHARVEGDAAGVHRATAGQRLRLRGQLSAVEPGEAGVAVLHLGLAGQAQTVRVVAAPSLVATAQAWSLPRTVSLDCLSQGVMMGEWLLVDCRE